MSLSTPTTKEISDNIISQLEASLNQSIPLLPKSFLRVLSKVLGAVFVILFKYGGFIFLQIFVSTCSASDTEVNGRTVNPLQRWGRTMGVEDQVGAETAELSIDITVQNQSGVLQSGAQLLNSGNGVTYLLLTSIVLDAPVVQGTIRAVSDQAGGDGSGAQGNLSPGDIVSFANPLPNVQGDASVVSQLVVGAEGETTESYRARVENRFKKPPQGGAKVDYEVWGEEPAGIVNCYPYTSECPGQVDVYAEATPASSGSPDGIPSTAQLVEVSNSIEFNENGLASRRPVGALANVLPIRRSGFQVTVQGIDQVDNLAQVQEDVTNALTTYFLAREPFIVGLSTPPRVDRITNSEVGGIISSVVSASGGIFTGQITVGPPGNISIYTLGEGEKSKVTAVLFA